MADYFERPPKTDGMSTFDTFHLKCKVVKFTKSWEEPADDNKIHSADMIALVFDKFPDESKNFMCAWKPDPSEKTVHEFAMTVGHPINSPIRGCYQLPNQWVKEDHIFVMNHAAEAIFIEALKHKKNLELIIKVLPEDADSVADDALNSGREIDTRFDF